MDSSLQFQSLNDDILAEIFRFLTLKDIALCQMVSMEWKNCTEKPFVWNRVQYDFQESQIKNKNEYIKWFINKISYYDVKELVINDSSCFLKFPDLQQIFYQPHFSLQSLELSVYNLQETEACMLCLLLVKSCPNLVSFCTYGQYLSDQFMEYFQLWTRLKNFSIMCNDNSFLGSHLQSLPPLQKVNQLYQGDLIFKTQINNK